MKYNRTDIPLREHARIEETGLSAGRRETSGRQHCEEERIREKLYLVLKRVMPQSTDREDFTRRLKEKGVGVIFRQNESGRIYGVTFIDHGSRTALNGSRLGKEFSANVFQERFAGNQNTEKQSLPHENKDWNYRQVYGGSRQAESVERRQEHETGISVGLLNPTSNSVPDYVEPLWIEELKRKRKKKKGKRL